MIEIPVWLVIMFIVWGLSSIVQMWLKMKALRVVREAVVLLFEGGYVESAGPHVKTKVANLGYLEGYAASVILREARWIIPWSYKRILNEYLVKWEVEKIEKGVIH